MVDSPKGKTMTNGADNLPERVQAIEEERIALASSVDTRFDQVDRRFDQVDRRFDQVDAAIVEQRVFTEFAYEKLDSKMDAGFREMDARFAKVDGRFARLERKIDQIIDLQIPKRPTDGSNGE